MITLIRNGTSCARLKPQASKRKHLIAAAVALATPAVAAMFAFQAEPQVAQAANQWWDLNGTTAGATDGSGVANGTWDNITSNWVGESTGTATSALWASGNVALFSAGTDATGDSTITVVGTQTISGLTFEEGNSLTFLGSGGFTLSGTTVTVNASANASMSNAIAGTSALTKSGAGTVILSGPLSYGGTTTVSAGTLTLQGTNSLGGNVTVNAGTLNLDYTINNNDKIKSTGTLTLGNNAVVNVIGANGAQDTNQSVATTSLSSNGVSAITVNKGDTQNTTLNLGAVTRGTAALVTLNSGGAGPGTAGFTTTNTPIGGILGGYATWGQNDWVANTAGTLSQLTSYSTDDYSTATNNVDATTDQSPTGVTINSLRFNNAAGSVNVNLSGANTITTGGILVTPNVGGNTAQISGTGTLTSGGNDLIVIQNNTASDFNIAAAITGTVGLTKGGAGNLVLSGANTASGTHTINAGMLRLGASGVIADAAPVVINAAGTLDMNGFDETVGSISGAGTITGGGGNLTVGGLNSSTTFSGPINHNGDLNKTGSGTLTLSGTNTFTGTLNINQGVVVASSSSALGSTSGGTTVASGAALQVTGAIAVGSGEFLTLNGTGVSNTGALRKTANNTTTYSGGVQWNTDGARINSDSGTLRLAGGLSGTGASPYNAQFGGAGVITVAGTIAGSIGKVLYDGTGTLNLTASGSFTGIIATGGAVSHLGFVGGTADTSGLNPTAFVADYIQLSNGASLNDNHTGNAGTALHPNKGIQLGVGGGKITEIADGTNLHIYRGLISGTGPFTKAGAGILAITGSQNSYSGATNITGGVLRIRTDAGPGQLGPGALPSGTALSISASSTFDMNVTTANQTVGSLAGAGVVNAPSNSSATLTFGADGTLTTWNGQFSTTAGAVTTLKLTKTGTGTMTIGVNNWQMSNTVAINGGVIKYGDALVGMGDTSQINIGASGTMDMNSIGVDTVGSITGSGSIINLGQLTSNSATSSTFSGPISGGATSSLIKVGAATLRLSGTNTYLGTTNVQGGVLQVASSANLGDAGNTLALSGGATVQALGAVTNSTRVLSLTGAGGTVDTGGNAVSFGNANGTGTATLTKVGTGSLTVNYARAAGVTVSAGNLKIAPNGQAAGVSVVGSLNLGANQLDLSDNHLIDHTDAVGTFNGATYTGLTGLVASGRNGNLWTGPGIITSQPAAQGGNFTTIGIAKASDIRPTTATATGTWAGQTITGTDTLVMYTYGGDATLDGKINVDDYIRIDSGIAAGLTGWSNGDFNYDGKVNIDDYTSFIDANIGTQGPQFFSAGGAVIAGSGSSGPSGVSAVPEPASLSLVVVAGAALVSRRRRPRE